jgi:murein L,D-transpeptidase YafK
MISRKLIGTIQLVSVPLALWVATAAPTFGGLGREGYRLAKFQPDNMLSNAKSWFGSNRNVASIGYERPALDTAVEQIHSALSRGNLNKSLEIANRLVEQYPNFRMGHLIRGDLLMLKAGRAVLTIGNIENVPSEKNRELADLREEAVVRLRSYHDRPGPNQIPRELVEMRSDQRYAIMVDTKRSRLFLYENTQPVPRLVTDFYVTQGKMGADKEREGDQKTPLGVYTVTDLLTKQKLTDFYGPLALPISYPNEWDKRQGKTGHGIWFHGVPANLVSRPPKASDGCVVLANADLEQLQRYVKIGTTPVVISESLDFIADETWLTEKQNILRVVDTWRRDFETAEVEKLLEHYSTQSYIEGMPVDQWRMKKLLPIAARKSPKLELSNMSVIRYAARDDMLVISFDQDFSVNGESQISKRKQYWVKEGSRWRIVHEIVPS